MVIIDCPGQEACHPLSAKPADAPKVIQHHMNNISNHGYCISIGLCFIVDGTCIWPTDAEGTYVFRRRDITVSINGLSPNVPNQYMDQWSIIVKWSHWDQLCGNMCENTCCRLLICNSVFCLGVYELKGVAT